MTSKRRRLLIATVPLVVAALALGGCSDTVEEASADYCTSLDDLNAEVASLRSLVAGDATQEQVSDQAEAVRGAYDATVTAAGNLDEAVSNEASSAYDTFSSTVEAIPDDSTLSETADQYSAAAQTYLDSLASIAQEAGCTPEPS